MRSRTGQLLVIDRRLAAISIASLHRNLHHAPLELQLIQPGHSLVQDGKGLCNRIAQQGEQVSIAPYAEEAVPAASVEEIIDLVLELIGLAFENVFFIAEASLAQFPEVLSAEPRHGPVHVLVLLAVGQLVDQDVHLVFEGGVELEPGKQGGIGEVDMASEGHAVENEAEPERKFGIVVDSNVGVAEEMAMDGVEEVILVSRRGVADGVLHSNEGHEVRSRQPHFLRCFGRR